MKKGFTLVELLAIIVVLAIISTITYSIVQKNIDTTKVKSFETSAKNVMEAAKEYVVTHYEENDFPEGGIDITNKELDLKHDEFISGIITKDDEGRIIVENLTDGVYCANGPKSNLEIEKGSCEASDETPPEISAKVLKTGIDNITILVKIQDAQSGLKELEYCIKDECEIIELENERSLVKKVIKFENLEKEKEYTIKLKVTNNTGKEEIKSKEIEIKAKTTEILEPEFSISSGTYSSAKILTITYPEVEGYEFKYQVGENEEIAIEQNKAKVEIKEPTTVVARIYKNSELIISNEINISGIDNTPPETKIAIEKEHEWTHEKKVIVGSNDTGTGMALRGYSYDDGINWQKESEIIVKANNLLKLRTRDKLGNIQNNFQVCDYVNGEFINCGNPTDSYNINKIDNSAPKVEIKVMRGEKGANDWYISNEVELEIKITDQSEKIVNGETILEDNGVGIKSVSGTMNNKTLNLSNPYSGAIGTNNITYRLTLTNNGEYIFKFKVSDKLDNSRENSITIKKDDVKPTISLRTNDFTWTSAITSISLFNHSTDNENVSKVTTKCTPTETLNPYQKQPNITCRITAGNGLYAEASATNIAYYYKAQANYRTESYDCSYKQCGSEQHCYTADYRGACFDGYIGSCETLVRTECHTVQCCCYNVPRTCYRSVFDHWSCPNSGLLENDRCYFR